MQKKESTTQLYQERVNLVIDYVHAHIGENISLATLADVSGFSMYHIHRILKAFLGESIGNFIIRSRMEKAAWMLRGTEMSIAEIAWEVGYDTPSSLTRVFQSMYGVSPSAYRNDKTITLMKETNIRHDLDLKTGVKELPSRNFMYIRCFGPYKKIDFTGVFSRLYKYMSSQFKRPETPDFEFTCVYLNDPSTTPAEKLMTDLGFCMEEAITPKGEIGYREIPAGKYLCALYKGPYDRLSDVYDTVLGKVIPEMGLRLRDEPAIECYPNDPRKEKPENYLTEIQIPIE